MSTRKKKAPKKTRKAKPVRGGSTRSASSSAAKKTARRKAKRTTRTTPPAPPLPVFDHVGIRVRDLVGARAFYEEALAPLGIAPRMTFPGVVGLGREEPAFWISQADPGETPARVHLAFTARSRADVDAFYAAAMAAGGTDNGAPGLRPQYHPSYYGAFVLDADGHNVEAVCHRPG